MRETHSRRATDGCEYYRLQRDFSKIANLYKNGLIQTRKFKCNAQKGFGKMKKILSFALAMTMGASLVCTPIAVHADTEQKDLVKLYDFNDLKTGVITETELQDLGLVTTKLDGNATMTIEDMSSDAKYGSLGKVLKYEPTSGDNGGTVIPTQIGFPINDYTMNTDEKVVVEYTFHWDATGSDNKDCFKSASFGTIGSSLLNISSGGNGILFQAYGSNNANRKFMELYNGNNGTVSMPNWYKVKQVYDYSEFESSKKGISYTVTDLSKDSVVMSGVGVIEQEKLANLTFSNNSGVGQVWLDDIRVYTLPKFEYKSATIENNTTNVFYDTKSMTATFSNEIKSVDTVSITGVATDKYTVTKSGKTVTVNFTDELEYDTTYEVNFTGVVDAYDQVLGDCKVSFTTEKAPDIRYNGVTYTQGVGTDYNSSVGGIVPNGLGGVSLELENLSDADKEVNIIFAVYASEGGIFEKVKSVGSTIPASNTATISLGMKMDDLSGKFVKAFVWENMETLMPWRGSISLNVTSD